MTSVWTSFRTPTVPVQNRARLLLLVFVACLTLPDAAVGQQAEDPLRIPGIVVTATQVPTDRDRLATPVTVLTRATLQEHGIASVADALRLVPGLTVVQSGSAGAQTSLFMRGGESNYVKVLVDGVSINDPGGSIDVVDLSTDQVERIEVVRGPASVLYGSDALAGVVQIFTRRGYDGPRVDGLILGGLGEQRYESGRYGLAEGNATLTGTSSGGWSYTLGAARSWTEGAYPMNNERSLQNLNARVAWNAGTNTRLSVSSRFSDSESGFPTDGSGNLADENAALDRQLWTTSFEAATQVHPRVQARLLAGHTERTQVSRDEQDSPADTFGVYASHMDAETTRSAADLHVNIRAFPSGMVTLGTSYQTTSGSTTYTSESEWGPDFAEADYSRSNKATYGEFLVEPVRDVHLTVGGRTDHNEAFGRFDTYRLGFSWNLSEGTRFRGALGRAFREPTFAENFGSGFFDIGNPDLVPERTRSWELGAERAFGAVLFGATWFDQSFRDLIQFTFATEDPEDPNYVNVAVARARGLEWTGEFRAGVVDISATYTHLRTTVIDPGLATDATFIEGERLLRRPDHAATLTVQLPVGAGNLSGTMHVVGKRDDVDFGQADFDQGIPAPRVELPRHTTFNVTAEHPIWSGSGGESPNRARLVLRVRNLLDAEYESIAGFPALGRIVQLGIRLGG